MSNLQVTIALQQPDLEDEQLQAQAESLLQQIKTDCEVESADLIAVENAPAGSKALGGFLLGMLSAEVNPANFKKLMSFLGARLSGKTIELEVEANGKKLKVKANSREELKAVIQEAKEFVGE